MGQTQLEQHDVVLVQETAFPTQMPREKLALGQHITKVFRFYKQAGPIGHRGVGILVRKTLRCCCLCSWVHDDAQAIAASTV